MNKRLGFSLLEVLIASSILAMAILGLISVLLVTTAQADSTKETTLAVEAADAVLARLRGTEFKALTDTFSSSRNSNIFSFN